MVKFIDVDPDEFVGRREGRKGALSYPILKAFLETQKKAVKVDRSEPPLSKKTIMSIRTSMDTYIKSHQMPIRTMQRGENLYLIRRDLDDEGNFDPNWSWDGEHADAAPDEDEVQSVATTPLNAAAVKARAVNKTPKKR